MHGLTCASQGTWVPPANQSWWFQSAYVLYNKTVIITRESACNSTNCNVKTLTPVVNSCYNYGTIYSLNSSGAMELIYNSGINPAIANSSSLENQYCVRIIGNIFYGPTNTTYIYNWYHSYESCLIGLFTGPYITCCQTNNCNTPINQSISKFDKKTWKIVTLACFIFLTILNSFKN